MTKETGPPMPPGNLTTCGVPTCERPNATFDVCNFHRAEELRVQLCASPYELDMMVAVIREEMLAAETRQREQYAASLRVDDDGWDGFATRYGRRALEGIIADVVAAENGRNNSLFKGAARVGGLIASGHVQESVAVDMVTAAGLSTGLTMDEVRPTVRGAVAKGKRKPWGPSR